MSNIDNVFARLAPDYIKKMYPNDEKMQEKVWKQRVERWSQNDLVITPPKKDYTKEHIDDESFHKAIRDDIEKAIGR